MAVEEVTEIWTLDTARVLDQEANEWEKAWLTVYKRVKTVEMLDAQSVSTTEIISSSFLCEPYAKFELLIDLTASGVAGNILIEVYTSDDGAKFYKKMDGLFGDLRYSGTAGNKKESVFGELNNSKVRLRAIASAGTYTLSAKLVLRS